MAFGDALRSTDGATVVLNVDTSQTQKLEQAEAQWRESVGTMSREALKLDLAQDRLRKSLSSYGAESAQAKRATIALKDAEEQNARAADRLSRENHELSRSTRTASSGFSSMRNRVIGLAAAYVGVHGLVMGIRSSVEAAKEEQNVLGQTKIAVQAAGLEWERYAGRINAVIRAQSQLGFDDEALMRTFQMFVRSTRDVNKALEFNALAADVARGRYIDLEQAAQIVNKANLGMSGALRRIGLDVEKNATRQELLNTLTRNYGRAAEEASDDAVAATDRLSVEFENMQEIVGKGLLPAVTNLSNRLADYFGDAQNQAEVQRRVNEAVETGEDVVRGLASAFGFLDSTILGPLKKLGLLDEAITTALILGLVAKTRRAAASFGFISAASSAATAKVVRDAAVAGRALDVAYRPRTFTVTGVGGAAGGGGGRLGGLLGTAAIVGGAIFGPELVEHIMAQRGLRVSDADFQRLKKAARRGQIGWADLDRLGQVLTDAQERELRGLIAQAGAQAIPDREGRGPRVGAPPAPGGRTGGGGGGGGPTESDLLLDVSRPGNERRDLEALRSYYARQIRVLEAKKKLTEKQKEKLRQLYGEIAGVQSQIDAIGEQARAKEEERGRKREEAERKAAERELQRMERIDRAAARQAERRGELLAGTGGTRANMRRQALRHVDETLAGLKKKKASEDQTLTRADFNQLATLFLGQFEMFERTYRNNFGSPGEGLQMHIQTHELRNQTALLTAIHGGAAGREIAAARQATAAYMDGM